MKVKYVHPIAGVSHGNILWAPAVPMRGGTFPATHPAAPGGRFGDGPGDGQIGATDRMNAFRGRGYWASCFPEGDGITLQCQRDQDAATAAKDIAEVFGWEVSIQS
jgi:hypothetical protein